MKSKIIPSIVLSLFLTSILTLGFNIRPVKASGTIYIRSDGSIEPSTAPILSIDNVTYTFTDNIINNSIVVERVNIAVDGAGYTLQGKGRGKGIYLGYLGGRSNVTIKNMKIKAFACGIYLYYSSSNSISGNNITNNGKGIYLYENPQSNSILGNNITSNGVGIALYRDCEYNIISGNNIANNGIGIDLSNSPHNRFYHNNFVDNTEQVGSWVSNSVWHNGYPSGGNYWSDYDGTDSYSGPHQNETGRDGIGDTPIHRDRYPLMRPFGFPTAIFAYSPEHPLAGESAAFNASASLDRGGNVTSYKWDFGDGTVTSTTSAIITHVYTAFGTYNVTLTVTDNDGLTDSTTKQITVLTAPIWMQWWFWTIVSAGIVALVGAAYLWKRKQPIQTKINKFGYTTNC